MTPSSRDRGARAAATDPRDVHVGSRAEWRAWLAAHHESPDWIWLVYPKKGSARFTDLTYDALVEEALCFGWIDSVARGHDADHAAIRMSPRRPGSGWAATNKRRVERLVADGRMTPAGLARIEAARRDGSWEALDAVERLQVPADLAAALDATPEARRHFDAFPPSARKLALTWIAAARRPETRASRIAETARLAARGERANQPKERR